MAIRPSLLHSRRPTLNWTTALTLAREQTRQRPTRPDALPRSDEAAEIVGVSMRIARAKTSSPAGLGRVFRCRYASDARHDSNPRYSDLVPVRYLLDPDRLAGLGPNTPWIRPIPLARPERFELPTFGSVGGSTGCSLAASPVSSACCPWIDRVIEAGSAGTGHVVGTILARSGHGFRP